MKFPTLARFCDVTGAALLMATMFAGFYWLGMAHAQMKIRTDCDGLGVVLLTGNRYECVSMPGSAP